MIASRPDEYPKAEADDSFISSTDNCRPSRGAAPTILRLYYRWLPFSPCLQHYVSRVDLLHGPKMEKGKKKAKGKKMDKSNYFQQTVSRSNALCLFCRLLPFLPCLPHRVSRHGLPCGP